jgi:hypothetical protein
VSQQPFTFSSIPRLTFSKSLIQKSSAIKKDDVVMIQRKKDPIFKIPHQARNRAKTQSNAQSILAYLCPPLLFIQHAHPQLHGCSPGLLEAHARALWVVNSPQENGLAYIPKA